MKGLTIKKYGQSQLRVLPEKIRPVPMKGLTIEKYGQSQLRVLPEKSPCEESYH